MGVHTGFVQEEPLGLRRLTMILAACVVEDVSKMYGHSETGIFFYNGASSTFT